MGDFAVGKTSLVRHFVEGIFEDKYLSTIGAKVDRKTILVQGDADPVPLTMLIWDLAGSEKFNHIVNGYYRGAAGGVLVCDLSRQDTLKTLVLYAQDFWRINPHVPLVVVGNKVDLVAERAITDKALAEVAAQCGSPWFTSSAKTGENVETLFQTLGQLLLGQGK